MWKFKIYTMNLQKLRVLPKKAGQNQVFEFTLTSIKEMKKKEIKEEQLESIRVMKGLSQKILFFGVLMTLFVETLLLICLAQTLLNQPSLCIDVC